MNLLPQDTINEIAAFSQYPIRKILASPSSRHKPMFEVVERCDFDRILSEEPSLITSGHIALSIDDILLDEIPNIRPLVVVSRCLVTSNRPEIRLRKFFGCNISWIASVEFLGRCKTFLAIKDDLLIAPSCCLNFHYGMIISVSKQIKTATFIPFLEEMNLISYEVMNLEFTEDDDVAFVVPSLRYFNRIGFGKVNLTSRPDIFHSSTISAYEYVLSYANYSRSWKLLSTIVQQSPFVAYWMKSGIEHLPDGLVIPTLKYQDEITFNIMLKMREKNASILQLEFRPDQEPEHLFPICKSLVIHEAYMVHGYHPNIKIVISTANADWQAISQVFPNARHVLC